jgi:phage internal scaffolding protein
MAGKRARERVGIDCSAGGLTQQCFAEMSDLNVIMSRWLRQGGDSPHRMPDFSAYRDVSHGWDYSDVMNISLELQGDFMELPADLRARFFNDPVKLLDFIGDPANNAECVSLGLVEPSEQSSLDVTVRTDSQQSSTSKEVVHETSSNES